MAESESTQAQKIKVAIQGGAGAFHEIAARNYFAEDIDVVPCETFENITTLIANKEIDFGIMAIENTVAGSLIPNYVLLKESVVKIIGEEYLRIKQNLIALSGQKIEDLTEVHSHYMAIAQSRKFFKNYPDIKLVESVDTALSAQKIQEKKLVGKGAIASDLAAEMYGLEILAPGIETNKRNYTRFLILTHQENNNNNTQDISKASICFSLPNYQGRLSQVLSVLAFYDLDLTKIQSMPIVGKEFQYFFYVDLAFDKYEKYTQGLTAIKPLVVDLKILGEYKYSIETLENIHHQ
ncbi:MAG: prephenate dehydratase [Salinivirgaceae bacterium]|jgi:prephenate dehydratase|nr:prephenate dehydratase [Salinivirgaceae bacterium]